MKVLFIFIIFILSSKNLTAKDLTNQLGRPDKWFNSLEGMEAIKNILSHQSTIGIWPKNINTAVKKHSGKKDSIEGTFDNSATLNELRILAKAFNATQKKIYKKSFLKGLECILESQYKNGGWPQRPHSSGYEQHITFNDGTMVGIMQFIQEVADSPIYSFVNKKTRRECIERFDLGVNCILACQITVNNKLTAWCAQHDKNNFNPVGARSYEHPSISGGESAGIIFLLMSLDMPSNEVIKSIIAAVKWYKKSKIDGFSFQKVNGDRLLIESDSAETMWARFYEIGSNRPIFSGRDGKIKYDVSEIEFERRNGYAWYVKTGEKVLSLWDKWKLKHEAKIKN
ncbi:MAG: pectate lyase [Verrucomicrobiales bacterium]